MTTRRVAWRRTDEVETDEWCTLTLRPSGVTLVGTVIGAWSGLPVRIEYRVLTNATGATTAVHVRQWHGFEQRQISLERTEKGAWTVDGAPARGLKGCTDVDLECSPATNALPIRRLRLAVGAREQIQAAWIRFPGLTVEKSRQSYTRVDLEGTYRYASGAFESDLNVDDDGLVYGYAAWRRTGAAEGSDETEPLDSVR
jgi:uncharacterized protein